MIVLGVIICCIGMFCYRKRQVEKKNKQKRSKQRMRSRLTNDYTKNSNVAMEVQSAMRETDPKEFYSDEEIDYW